MGRISTLDAGYQTGDLSLYPEVIDDVETLYEVSNNASTTLKQSLPYNGKIIIVEDNSAFPNKGLLRLGPKPGEAGQAELIYYGKKSNNTFSELIRGFAGSVQTSWTARKTYASNAVMAEHHNAVKDAILKTQWNIGVKDFPATASLNGILKNLEDRFLAPKPIFRGFPLKGTGPLTVRFQNFSGGDVIRFLWDFGDGSTSVERNPTHTYQTDGFYTVKLNIITSTGAQGVSTKSNYVQVSDELSIPFFYVRQVDPSKPAYSVETANSENDRLGLSPGDPGYKVPATWQFVDQTDGDVAQRFWVFDDGMSETQLDPDIHIAEHVFEAPGEYEPSLLLVFGNQALRRVFLTEIVTVL